MKLIALFYFIFYLFEGFIVWKSRTLGSQILLTAYVVVFAFQESMRYDQLRDVVAKRKPGWEYLQEV